MTSQEMLEALVVKSTFRNTLLDIIDILGESEIELFSKFSYEAREKIHASVFSGSPPDPTLSSVAHRKVWCAISGHYFSPEGGPDHGVCRICGAFA